MLPAAPRPRPRRAALVAARPRRAHRQVPHRYAGRLARRLVALLAASSTPTSARPPSASSRRWPAPPRASAGPRSRWRWPGSATGPGVTAPILGARTAQQLRGALGVEELTLPDEITPALDDVSGPAEAARGTSDHDAATPAPAGARGWSGSSSGSPSPATTRARWSPRCWSSGPSTAAGSSTGSGRPRRHPPRGAAAQDHPGPADALQTVRLRPPQSARRLAGVSPPRQCSCPARAPPSAAVTARRRPAARRRPPIRSAGRSPARRPARASPAGRLLHPFSSTVSRSSPARPRSTTRHVPPATTHSLRPAAEVAGRSARAAPSGRNAGTTSTTAGSSPSRDARPVMLSKVHSPLTSGPGRGW